MPTIPSIAGFAEQTAANPAYFTENAEKSGVNGYADRGACEKKLVLTGNETEIFSKQDGESSWICDIVDIPMVGRHNVRNALAASVVARILDVSREQIRSAIRRFRPKEHDALEHALEPVRTIRGIKMVNDSKATNVDAARAAIDSISDPLLLIMGGYDKGNDYSPLIDLVKSKVKALILLGEHTARIRNALEPHVRYSGCNDYGSRRRDSILAR